MSLRSYKPITPGLRGRIIVDKSNLHKGRPEKSLTVRIAKSGGRNHRGVITVKHRGGGARKLYRMITFRRQANDVLGKIERIEYDPNRTANIAFVQGEKKHYVVATESMKIGQTIGGTEITDGACLQLKDIPSGIKVHNIEIKPNTRASMVRSAGTFAQVLGTDGNQVILKLPSGQRKKINKNCSAVIGIVSNSDHMNTVKGKAGATRNLGRRPHVRGVAMNKRCHPNGGGRGKQKGRQPVSPTGKIAKGGRTRRTS